MKLYGQRDTAGGLGHHKAFVASLRSNVTLADRYRISDNNDGGP